jgi:hypothetical protein
MSEILDRIEELRRGGIKDRLARGAGILADLWRQGIRCGNGWKKDCVCPAKNEFCAAKNKWVGLLVDHHAAVPYGLTGAEDFFVIEAMTPTMIKASGLVVLVEVPGARKPLKLGGDVQTWDIFPELEVMDPDNVPGFLETVVRLQEKI